MTSPANRECPSVVWLGHKQHFIGGDNCRFGMATLVRGEFVVSTVGDYYPRGEDSKRTTIGCDRFLETYVFMAVPGKFQDCGCPEIADLCEIDSEGYQEPAEAQTGHMRMVAKYLEMGPSHG